MRIDTHGELRGTGRTLDAALEADGLVFHHTRNPLTRRAQRYWEESRSVVLSLEEVATVETATEEIWRLCLLAAAAVIERHEWSYASLGVPEMLVPAIEHSWEQETASVYARLDLAFGADGSPPRLLEVNAQTPTGLLESSVVQWSWLEQTFAARGCDQHNSLHDRLVAAWRDVAPSLPGPGLHLGWTRADTSGEDAMTVTYLAETAHQAGLPVRTLPVEEFGWHAGRREFVDLEGDRMRSVFTLYPYEWAVGDSFGPRIVKRITAGDCWIEPAWKSVVGSKGFLAVLHALFPESPYLLPAFLDGPHDLTDYAIKPLLGREGQGVSLLLEGLPWARGPGLTEHDGGGRVFQQLANLFSEQGRSYVLGSWLVQGESAGSGFRESDGPVTDNLSRFVPHRIEG